MGEARGMQRVHDKCLYGFDEGIWKENVWEENIKIDFNGRAQNGEQWLAVVKRKTDFL